jgi:S1-C subfamily serine protease
VAELVDALVHLRRVALTGLEEARPAGIPVLDSFDQVTEAAARLGLADALSVFARPSVTRDNGVNPGNVVWYGSSPGMIAPLGSAAPQAREAAAAEIARAIGRLQPLLDEPRAGPLFAAWLNIPSIDDDVLLVNGRPVITNWGLLPAAVAAAPAARRAHFERGLGRFLPAAFAPPPFVTEDGPAAAAVTSPPPASGPAADAVAQARVTPESVSLQRGPQVTPQAVAVAAASEPPARPWLPIAIATAISALLLAILLAPGVLMYPLGQPAARAVDPGIVAQTRQTLERRLEALQTMLRQGTCVTDGPANNHATNAGPAGPGAGLSPARPPAAQPLVPPSPERLATPPAAGGQPTNLVAHLDRVTALIVAPKRDGEGGSFGTGFFINDRQLVTNRHVVEEGNPSRIFVVSKAFGRAIEGRVTASSRSSEIGSNDFAVVEIAEAQGTPITLTNTVTRGDSVVAAGFPGFVMRTDQMFKRLMEGNLSSVPDPVVTQGWVTATQTSEHGLPVLVHGATISQGNSGGPLTDLCGRVVGVNTYGSVDAENALRLNFALHAEGLRKFLDDRHITYTKDDTACQPIPLAPGATAAANPGAGDARPGAATPPSAPQPAPSPGAAPPTSPQPPTAPGTGAGTIPSGAADARPGAVSPAATPPTPAQR